MTKHVDPVQLRQILNEKFNEEELKTLCFDLNIVYEDLGGRGRAANARELVSFAQRNGRLDEVWDYVERKRPLPQTTDNLLSPLDDPKWQADLKNYYASLKKRVGFVRILGRNSAEPLENVFTHVNVLDKLTAEQRYDINNLMVEHAPRDFGRFERMKRVAGDEAVAEHSKLFILGKPGAGKTTFMKHTALRAIKREINKVPIFVTLKELSDSGMEIVPFMVRQFEVHQFPEPESFIRQVLNNGDAIVLFDGLDEVNLEDNKRANMIQAINEFVYRYNDCPVLITCRVAATDYSFTQFEYVEMADFDDEQIGRYIDHWFLADEVKRVNCRKALLENKDYKAVRELAQVPLLLALLCLVFEERNEFPPERHEIYEEATRALLSKWDASRNISRDTIYQQLSLGRKQKMLAKIAAQAFENGEYFLRERDVVRQIKEYLVGVPGLGEPDAEKVLISMEAQHGILVERAHAIYSFSHLILQEYFTALYVVNNDERNSVDWLMQYVGDKRWREVFLLTAGMLTDAIKFCKHLLLLANEQIGLKTIILLKWIIQKRKLIGLPNKPEYRAILIYRILSNVIEIKRTQAFVYAFDRARTLAQTLDSKGELALSRDISFVRQLSSILSQGADSNLAKAFPRIFTRILEQAEELNLMGMVEDLKLLKTPNADAKWKAWRNFSEIFGAILVKHQDQWDIYCKFPVLDDEVTEWATLSDQEIILIAQYLEANNLLVQCLQVAYVPNRQAILDQILLPPSP